MRYCVWKRSLCWRGVFLEHDCNWLKLDKCRCLLCFDGWQPTMLTSAADRGIVNDFDLRIVLFSDSDWGRDWRIGSSENLELSNGQVCPYFDALIISTHKSAQYRSNWDGDGETDWQIEPARVWACQHEGEKLTGVFGKTRTTIHQQWWWWLFK